MIDITSFSRPLCTNQKIFDHKNQYSRDVGGTNKVHISGYAAKNETNATHVVFFTSDREWQIKSWDTDNINVMMRRQRKAIFIKTKIEKLVVVPKGKLLIIFFLF